MIAATMLMTELISASEMSTAFIDAMVRSYSSASSMSVTSVHPLWLVYVSALGSPEILNAARFLAVWIW